MSEHPGDTYAEQLDGVDRYLPPGVDAVGVYLVEPAPVRERPATSYTVGQYAAPIVGAGQPTLVAGFMPTRTRLTLRNLGTATVWIGPDPSGVTPTSSFPIMAGEVRELHTSEAVYAATDTGAAGPSLVATLAEFASGS